MADIFISHRSVDAADALRLASDLRDEGHSVWLDIWQVDLGDSIVEWIDTGLKSSQYLLLCCSGAGVYAPWTGREWMSTLARQLSGHRVRIIPVLFAGGEVPVILADIKYVSLVDDWAGGVSQICAALAG